ncbi:MAG: hypothetical protein WCG85_09780 [Polyangia bacterium]
MRRTAEQDPRPEGTRRVPLHLQRQGKGAFHMWKRWGRLTRFVESARIALAREFAIWDSLKLSAVDEVRLQTNDSKSEYRVTVSEHRAALSDEALFAGMVLVYSYALAEAALADRLGKEVIDAGIEVWGDALLRKAGNTWDGVTDGKAGLVEVAVVRNAIAHGSMMIDQAAVNRLASASSSVSWPVGHVIDLTLDDLRKYRMRLKSLLRLGGVRS